MEGGLEREPWLHWLELLVSLSQTGSSRNLCASAATSPPQIGHDAGSMSNSLLVSGLASTSHLDISVTVAVAADPDSSMFFKALYIMSPFLLSSTTSSGSLSVFWTFHVGPVWCNIQLLLGARLHLRIVLCGLHPLRWILLSLLGRRDFKDNVDRCVCLSFLVIFI